MASASPPNSFLLFDWRISSRSLQNPLQCGLWSGSIVPCSTPKHSKAATDRIYFLNDAVKGPKAICGWTLIAHAIPSNPIPSLRPKNLLLGLPSVAYLSLLIVPKRDEAVMEKEECGLDLRSAVAMDNSYIKI